MVLQVVRLHRPVLLQSGIAMQLRDRLLVARVQLDEPPVLEGEPDQQVDEPLPGVARIGLGLQQRQHAVGEAVHAPVEGQEDVLLAGEVVVERRLGEAQLRGDLTQRGLRVAFAHEEVESDVEDPLPRRR